MDKEKVHTNIVIIGHINSGKSTPGHLIYKFGSIDKHAFERFEKEVAGKNRSFWVLNRLKAECERGITFDIALWEFETMTTMYSCIVIDASGHLDFVKNITFSSQTDSAVFIIDSITDGLNALLTFLSFSLGVNRMSFRCCNRIDAFSKTRYDEIVQEVSSYLKKVACNPDITLYFSNIGFEGYNLNETSKEDRRTEMVHFNVYNGVKKDYSKKKYRGYFASMFNDGYPDGSPVMFRDDLSDNYQ